MLRGLRRLNQAGRGLTPAQIAILVQANRLVSVSQPAKAAPLFANLAEELDRSGHPRRAANLHAQAAHAFADSQDEANALAHARKALQLFMQYQMVQRTPVFYANIVRKMGARNMTAAVSTLQKEFGEQVSALPAPAPAAKPRGHLPTSCSQCGAPLRSDEVAWVDEVTAECVYCGALARAES